jgi:hypothetical protein
MDALREDSATHGQQQHLRAWPIARRFTVSAAGTARTDTGEAFVGADVRLARQWVWTMIRSHAATGTVGALIIVEDELTGRHELLITEHGRYTHDETEEPETTEAVEAGIVLPGTLETNIAGDTDRPEPVTTRGMGATSHLDRPVAQHVAAVPVLTGPGTTVARRATVRSVVRWPVPGTRKRGPRMRSRSRAVLAVAGVAVVAGVLAWSGISWMNPAAPATAPSSAPGPLWQTPEGFSPSAASGEVVAGVQDGQLRILHGADGTPLHLDAAIPAADPAAVDVFGPPQLQLVSAGTGSGVVLAEGKAPLAFKDKSVLNRGTMPALYARKGTGFQYWTVQGGQLADINSPVAGAALFGVVDSGPVWASADGKVIYTPANGPSRTVTVEVPAPGASITAWIKVDESRAVFLWSSGGTKTLTVHDTTDGKGGKILARSELPAGAIVEQAGGVLVTRSGPGSAVTGSVAVNAQGRAVAPAPCADPSAAGGRLWCPVPSGTGWAAPDGASTISRPVIGGEDFVLSRSGTGFQAARMEKPTPTPEEKK